MLATINLNNLLEFVQVAEEQYLLDKCDPWIDVLVNDEDDIITIKVQSSKGLYSKLTIA